MFARPFSGIVSAPAPRRSNAERMKKPNAMREESLLVYAVGNSVRRHLCQYLMCRSVSSFESPIPKDVLEYSSNVYVLRFWGFLPAAGVALKLLSVPWPLKVSRSGATFNPNLKVSRVVALIFWSETTEAVRR